MKKQKDYFKEKKYLKESKLSKVLNSMKTLIFSATAFATSVIFWLFGILTSQTVLAGGLQSSKFVTGTQKMLEDATNVLIVLAPVITIFVVGYCFIRKGAADEMDFKKWSTRITTAIVCCIGVVSASIIVKVIMEYYK